MSPKVSVIIPVYNTEKYLRQCLLSIVNQTLKDLEIIIINDGSTDNSLAVIESFACNDDRISVVSQENMGQSISRNIGIDKCSGQFIYFMDSDDVLAENALFDCYNLAISNELDFVFFNASLLNEDSVKPLNFDYKRAHIEENRIFSGVQMLEYLVNTNCYRASVCLHFVNRKLISQNNLRFYPGILHEDELFSALAYFHSKRICYLNESFFKRRVRPGSIMTTAFRMKNAMSYFTVLSQIRKFCKGRGFEMEKACDRLIRYIINPTCYNAASLRISERLEILIHCLKNDYVKYISLKNLLVLLFPTLIKIKGYTKRFALHKS